MHRRQFIRATMAALALPSLSVHTSRLWAATGGDARFLLVFLRGGYDATNLLVPVGSPFYYESRPNIAIPRPGNEAGSALPIDADWALHPALRETLWPMFRDGALAFVPFAGTDDLTRSHFETQDSIEFGQAPGGAGPRNTGSGFLGRLAAQVAGAQPIAFTDQLPVAFRGDLNVPNMSLRNLSRPAIDERQRRLIAAMYHGTPLEPLVAEGFDTRDEVMRSLADEMEAANRNAISAKGFEVEARRIARLMKERYTMGFVDVGGWDTHVGQGGSTGYLAGRLEELGRGLAAFAEEIGPLWRDTVIVVLSEFGRTFRENGNRGTDHGHGSVYWVLGGAVRGGRVVGEQQKLTAATLFQNRDYPVLNDYRSLLGSLFGRLYGLNDAALQRVFPGARSKDFQLL